MTNNNFPMILIAIITLLTNCNGSNNKANEQVKNDNNTT